MKLMHTIYKPIINLCMGATGLLLAGTAMAAPGTISQAPLFLGGSTPPNIFFLTDDSSSMTGETMTQSEYGTITSPAADGSPTELGDFIHRKGYDCTFEGTFSNPADVYSVVLEMNRSIANEACNVTAEEEWRSRDYTFNRLYYNPNRKYEPWNGVDIKGEPYTNADVTAAWINPFDPEAGTINLLTESALTDRSDGANGNRVYYASTEWAKWCGDSEIPMSQCYGWRYYYYDENNTRQMKWVHELPKTAQEGVINTQTNFANWFTYHRSRDHVAKFALSKVISQIENARIGFSPINDRNLSIAVDYNDETHRNNVLHNVFLNTPVGATPLLSALYDVGQYFESGTALSTSSKSGFDAGTSPILSKSDGGTCQRNAAILLTDGFYNSDITFDIGNEDGNGIDGNGSASIFDRGLFGDEQSNTLADIAMYYFETDLAPNLDDRVMWTKREADSIPPDSDPAPTFMHQHLNTYTIAFGVKGSLDPATSDPADSGFAWPNPAENNKHKIDDLWHAAYNSRGLFLSANNSEQLATSLSDALPSDADIIGSPAKIAFSDFQLDDNSKVFYSRFSPLDWSGEFRAREIINTEIISEDVLWDAASSLPLASKRNIISFDGKKGIPFLWENLSLTQRLALGNGNISEGKSVLDYLRGDQSKEQRTGNGNYRNRNTLLGDIVSSGPEYVGKPRFLFPNTELFGAEDGNAYYDFWRTNQTRPAVVYVGANDGMLHGFDAENGTELIAYIPEIVFEKLSKLTNPDYGHQFFVDSSPRQFDALFSPSWTTSDAWHTVLTGGLGAGGKGWYALDVTDPDFANKDPNKIVLWEFNEGDDIQTPGEPSDIGYSFSQPMVILTNSEKNGKKRWAVVTGNGYNSASGIAKLFIIFLDADPADGWQEGALEDYIEISTQTGGPAPSDMNGLSSPYAVDSDGDWITDRIYAGDVKGHLWAFDLSSTNPLEWQVSYSNGSTPRPLFTAINTDGDTQPITARPTAIRHPQVKRNSSNTPNILVYFGTGQYLANGDQNNKDTQSFYAVWDQGTGGLTRSTLQTQNFEANYGTSTVGDNSFETLDARFSNDSITVPYGDPSKPKRYGWFVDLEDDKFAGTGERIFTPAYIQGITAPDRSQHQIVYFTTFAPNASSCGSGGSTWFFAMDALNGAPPPMPVIDLDGNNIVDDNDRAYGSDNNPAVPSGTREAAGNGGAASFTSTGVASSTPNSGTPSLNKRWNDPAQQSGRLSWKEIRL